MVYKTQNVGRTVMWRRPSTGRLKFNTEHEINANGEIAEAELNLGGKKTPTLFSLTLENGQSVAIRFNPELFTKNGLNRGHFDDAVRNGEDAKRRNPRSLEMLSPVEILHSRPGGGRISPGQISANCELAKRLLQGLVVLHGFENALKLTKMAMEEKNRTYKTA